MTYTILKSINVSKSLKKHTFKNAMSENIKKLKNGTFWITKRRIEKKERMNIFENQIILVLT